MNIKWPPLQLQSRFFPLAAAGCRFKSRLIHQHEMYYLEEKQRTHLIFDDEIKKEPQCSHKVRRTFYLTTWPVLLEREYFNNEDGDVRHRSRGFTL